MVKPFPDRRCRMTTAITYPPPPFLKVTLAHAWALLSFEKMSLFVLVLFLEATGLYLEGCGSLQPSLWSVSVLLSNSFYFSPLQCKKFRDKLTPDKRKIFKEKLQASEVFKDKKSSYPLTWVARILINAYFEHWKSLSLMLNTAISREVVGKVHATIPKGIVGGFEFTVLQRNLKEWHWRPRTYVCEC